VTAEYAESIRRGQKLFVSQQAACTSCHTDYGRTPTYRYDVWGVPNRVRDLTDKTRHWAREPADFARQLKVGIHAANMPAVPSGTTDREVADLVHFVRELPFPQRLPEDVRRAVEGKSP
jgi:mono/diheme cytochrome c family protein